MNDSRIEREKEYHDKFFESGDREQTQKFYSVFGASTDHFEQYLVERCRGKTVLEYGCGEGQWSYAYFLAEHGANVTGIDISDVAIAIARGTALERGLEIDFRVMNGEAMEFADNSFDLICGSAILHHLDLNKAYSELARTMKPNGSAIFSEPLGHNPLINMYRKRTPQLRTADEHPLKMHDLRLARKYFGRVEMKSYYLLALGGVQFRNSSFYPRLRDFLSACDRLLFAAMPFLRRYAWISIITLSQPKKPA
jgi:2-polyprenyl-3-methyl-5-hydroxy-6-metoxy-1,4-benzoquinol methylase